MAAQSSPDIRQNPHADTGTRYFWKLFMEAIYGSCSWKLFMEAIHGSSGQPFMEAFYGSYSWKLFMVVEAIHGSSFMEAQGSHTHGNSLKMGENPYGRHHIWGKIGKNPCG